MTKLNLFVLYLGFIPIFFYLLWGCWINENKRETLAKFVVAGFIAIWWPVMAILALSFSACILLILVLVMLAYGVTHGLNTSTVHLRPKWADHQSLARKS